MVVNPYQKKWCELTEEQRAKRRANAKACRIRRMQRIKEEPDSVEAAIWEDRKERQRELAREHYRENREEKIAHATQRYREIQCIRPFPIVI